MPAVEVHGLVKRYGDLVAVDDVSFTVAEGEVFALLGPNGAGKTTTVEIVEGLRSRDDGEVRVLGCDPAVERRKLSARLGLMLQDTDLYAGIRAEEAVRLFASLYGKRGGADELVERLGLGGVRRTTYRRLSGGERRRVALALALVAEPDVAFLDEPTAGMDIEGRVQTWEIVSELRARGTTVILTTHLLDEAERVADQVGILHRGRLVALGSVAELTERGGRELSFTLDEPVPAADLVTAIGVAVVASGTATYRVESADPTPGLVAKLASFCSERGVLIRHLDVGAASLADIYLELTRS